MEFIITSAGLNALAATESGGPTIDVVAYRLGDAVNYVPNKDTDTNIRGNLVYSGTTVSTNVYDANTVDVLITLPASIGPFNFGEIGLYLPGNILFALMSYDILQSKTTAATTGVASVRNIHALLKTSQGAAAFNITMAASNVVPVYGSGAVIGAPDSMSGSPTIAVTEEDTADGTALQLVRASSTQWDIVGYTRLLSFTASSPGTSGGKTTFSSANLANIENGTYKYIVQGPNGNLASIESRVGNVFTLNRTTPWLSNGSQCTLWQKTAERVALVGIRSNEIGSVYNTMNLIWSGPTLSGSYSPSEIATASYWGVTPAKSGYYGYGQPSLTLPSDPLNPTHWEPFINALTTLCDLLNIPIVLNLTGFSAAWYDAKYEAARWAYIVSLVKECDRKRFEVDLENCPPVRLNFHTYSVFNYRDTVISDQIGRKKILNLGVRFPTKAQQLAFFNSGGYIGLGIRDILPAPLNNGAATQSYVAVSNLLKSMGIITVGAWETKTTGSLSVVGSSVSKGSGGDATDKFVWEASSASRRAVLDMELGPLDVTTQAVQRYGFAVDISANGLWMIVGAPGGSGIQGYAVVYSRASLAGSWVRHATLRATDTTAVVSDSGDNFGASVAVSTNGNFFAVGAPLHSSIASNQGAVYIFQKADVVGTAWVVLPKQVITAGTGTISAGALFGTVVTFGSGTYDLMIGAVNESTAFTNTGAIYHYSANSLSTNFTLVGKIVSNNSHAGRRFGCSIAISGNGLKMIVGASGENTANGTASGAVHMFSRATGTAGTAWSIVETLPGAAADSHLGYSVDMNNSGDWAVASSLMSTSGAVNQYYSSGGTNYLLVDTFTGSGTSAFGYSVRLSKVTGTTLFVGSPEADVNVGGDTILLAGQVNMYRRTSLTTPFDLASPVQVLDVTERNPWDSTGTCLALYMSKTESTTNFGEFTLAVGAPKDEIRSDIVSGTGALLVYGSTGVGDSYRDTGEFHSTPLMPLNLRQASNSGFYRALNAGNAYTLLFRYFAPIGSDTNRDFNPVDFDPVDMRRYGDAFGRNFELEIYGKVVNNEEGLDLKVVITDMDSGEWLSGITTTANSGSVTEARDGRNSASDTYSVTLLYGKPRQLASIVAPTGTLINTPIASIGTGGTFNSRNV